MINELLINNLQLKEGDIRQLESANPIALFLGDSGLGDGDIRGV